MNLVSELSCASFVVLFDFLLVFSLILNTLAIELCPVASAIDLIPLATIAAVGLIDEYVFIAVFAKVAICSL